MDTLNDLPIMRFADQAAWRQWLDKHHAQPPGGVWLKFAKKNTSATSVSYAEALEEALCYGWIDGQVQRYDEQFYLQRFTPRRPKSVWSKTNTEKATALITAGKMQPAGLRAIGAAKADGRWAAAYLSSSNMIIPEDFQAALDASPTAKAYFETLNRLNRYAFYYRIQSVVRPETRAKKIKRFIAMLEKREKLYP